MFDPYARLESVPAETSEFFRAEVEAFMAHAKFARPLAWAAVRRLQSACLHEKPASPEGFAASVWTLLGR